MTRGHVASPVWAWHCDECGRAFGPLCWNQGELPTPDDMRARGWFIAELYGDLCPSCVAERGPASQDVRP